VSHTSAVPAISKRWKFDPHPKREQGDYLAMLLLNYDCLTVDEQEKLILLFLALQTWV
jgi:hypothetical protein